MHIYFFFLFFPINIFVSFIFIALFPNWHLALVCFPVCALVSFVLVDIVFGFLCLLGQSIVLYFCWAVLILLMGVHVYIYIYVYSVTFFTVVINLCLYVGLLQFCVFLFFPLFSFFFIFFPLFLNFNFLNLLYFFYIYSFVCFSSCSFPLAVNLQCI